MKAGDALFSLGAFVALWVWTGAPWSWFIILFLAAITLNLIVTASKR